MKEILNHLQEKNHFQFTSALIRVFISILLLRKTYVIWLSRSLFFDKASILNRHIKSTDSILSSILYDYTEIYFLGLIGLIIFFFFGIGRKITPILLVLFYKIFQIKIGLHLNGGDNLLIFVLIYYIFIDSYNYFTIKERINNENNNLKNLISNLACYAICIHICLIYFISALHKIHSDVWFNGVATYYILSLNRFSSNFASLINKNGFLVSIITYGTILIELLFPFLVWIKRWRYFFLISGALMHFGIFLTMMLFEFQSFFIVLYLFFIPDEINYKYYEKINAKFLIFVNKNISKWKRVKAQ